MHKNWLSGSKLAIVGDWHYNTRTNTIHREYRMEPFWKRANNWSILRSNWLSTAFVQKDQNHRRYCLRSLISERNSVSYPRGLEIIFAAPNVFSPTFFYHMMMIFIVLVAHHAILTPVWNDKAIGKTIIMPPVRHKTVCNSSVHLGIAMICQKLTTSLIT